MATQPIGTFATRDKNGCFLGLFSLDEARHLWRGYNAMIKDGAILVPRTIEFAEAVAAMSSMSVSFEQIEDFRQRHAALRARDTVEGLSSIDAGLFWKRMARVPLTARSKSSRRIARLTPKQLDAAFGSGWYLVTDDEAWVTLDLPPEELLQLVDEVTELTGRFSRSDAAGRPAPRYVSDATREANQKKRHKERLKQMRARDWSHEEDEVLRQMYPAHGPNVNEWTVHLFARKKRDIEKRAEALGLVYSPSATPPQQAASRDLSRAWDAPVEPARSIVDRAFRCGRWLHRVNDGDTWHWQWQVDGVWQRVCEGYRPPTTRQVEALLGSREAPPNATRPPRHDLEAQPRPEGSPSVTATLGMARPGTAARGATRSPKHASSHSSTESNEAGRPLGEEMKSESAHSCDAVYAGKVRPTTIAGEYMRIEAVDWSADTGRVHSTGADASQSVGRVRLIGYFPATRAIAVMEDIQSRWLASKQAAFLRDKSYKDLCYGGASAKRRATGEYCWNLRNSRERSNQRDEYLDVARTRAIDGNGVVHWDDVFNVNGLWHDYLVFGELLPCLQHPLPLNDLGYEAWADYLRESLSTEGLSRDHLLDIASALAECAQTLGDGVLRIADRQGATCGFGWESLRLFTVGGYEYDSRDNTFTLTDTLFDDKGRYRTIGRQLGIERLPKDVRSALLREQNEVARLVDPPSTGPTDTAARAMPGDHPQYYVYDQETIDAITALWQEDLDGFAPDARHRSQGNRLSELADREVFELYWSRHDIDFSGRPTSGSIDFSGFDEESVLRSHGYNLSEREGLSPSERRSILADVIGRGVLSKWQIIKHLRMLVNTRQNNPSMENACYKWESDINWLLRSV